MEKFSQINNCHMPDALRYDRVLRGRNGDIYGLYIQNEYEIQNLEQFLDFISSHPFETILSYDYILNFIENYNKNRRLNNLDEICIPTHLQVLEAIEKAKLHKYYESKENSHFYINEISNSLKHYLGHGQRVILSYFDERFKNRAISFLAPYFSSPDNIEYPDIINNLDVPIDFTEKHETDERYQYYDSDTLGSFDYYYDIKINERIIIKSAVNLNVKAYNLKTIVLMHEMGHWAFEEILQNHVIGGRLDERASYNHSLLLSTLFFSEEINECFAQQFALHFLQQDKNHFDVFMKLNQHQSSLYKIYQQTNSYPLEKLIDTLLNIFKTLNICKMKHSSDFKDKYVENPFLKIQFGDLLNELKKNK